MSEHESTTNVSNADTAESLRAHVERSGAQLRELETTLAEMLQDHDTLQEDCDATRAFVEGARTDLQRAERALARLEAGTFGRCVDCGEQIAPARLEAIPEAERCSSCA